MRRRSLQRFRTICCVWCPAGSIGVLSWTCPERDWAARGAATQKEGVPRGLEELAADSSLEAGSPEFSDDVRVETRTPSAL